MLQFCIKCVVAKFLSNIKMPLLAPRVVIKGRLRWGDRSNERVTRGDRVGAPWWRHLGLLLSPTINLFIVHNIYSMVNL